jgi:predicted secreted protein
MANKKSELVVVLGTLVLMATLLVAVPATSLKPYDPFVDFDDNGKIGLSDLVMLAQSYGTNGTPVAKAEMLYDSGWVNVTGQFENEYTVTHNLKMTTDGLMVDARGRTSTEFNITFGGTDHDVAYALVQTADGGYALAGYTASFGAGSQDFWLVKTDASGNMQWSKTYGGTDWDETHALVQTADGGYALAGHTESFGAGGIDFWLVKTDANGNMQWNKTYGGTSNDEAHAMVQTADGGYALAGYTGSTYGASYADFWLVKTDASGNTGGVESGLAWVDSSANTITLYRGATDAYWNFVRVRMWMPKQTP